ncbi:MAG: glycoside hydrolase family 2, partial [Saprospiraceae bacterium]|nr:glycoside hydrolase family 2 [Saprospiraceae bacterium]
MNRFCQLLLLILLFSTALLNAQTRSRQNFDRDWKFSFGHAHNAEKDFNFGLETVFSKSGGAWNTVIEPRFKDSLWRSLSLPHDWAVELPFVNDPAFNVMAHGYKPLGGNYPTTSIGWYRKHFTVAKTEEGKRFQIQFDGVFRDAEFWINGFYLGNNKSGYIGVAYDITDFLRFGSDNVVVVRADATQYEGWFYEGAGIYRHVWLDAFEDTHIANDGIFAYSKIDGKNAVLTVETEINNEGDGATALTTEVVLLDRNGKIVAQSPAQNIRLEVNKSGKTSHVISLANPRLWNLDDPYLYR